MTSEQFLKLKQEVEETKAEADRAQGALDQLMVTLKEQFQCSDLKQARKLLEELEEKKDRAEVILDKAQKEYERKWKKTSSD